MADRVRVFIYGHSFPARLLRRSRETGSSMAELLGLAPDWLCDVFVEGHPGLTFGRIFDSTDHYIRKIAAEPIDILIIDMGTNDLCDPSGTPDTVVQQTTRFLDLILGLALPPRHVVVLSVIRRSRITRAGQITVSTFNNRAGRFNSQLVRRLRSDYLSVRMYTQRRVNHPWLLIDGCHLTVEGMIRYCRGIREVVARFRLH